MNLYKLTLIWENYKGDQYDANYGFVIASETAQGARKIANESKDDGSERDYDLKTGKYMREKNNIWLKTEYSKIQKIGNAAKGIKKGILLTDHRAG